MPAAKRLRRRAAICPLAALALACAVAPASGWGAASRPAQGDLSPRLAELAKPSVRTAPPAAQAKRLGLARHGPGSLLREGNRVLVEVGFDRGAAAGVGDLRAAGAKVVHVSPRYQTVTVAAKPGELARLSGVPRVAGATEVLEPIVYSAGEPGPVTSAITPCFGAATSEGDEQLRAAQARAEFGVDGSGVKVGVLSDSFDLDSEAATEAVDDVASGDLPGAANPCQRETPVELLDDPETEGSDEGRAMAQIVHDLAPGADLSFATAFTGLTAFADNIRSLRDAGATVIVDDVSYFSEPFFQEGPVGVAVSDVVESGVAYFSSAGNNNLVSGENDIASWEAPEYRDSLDCPAPLVAFSDFLEEEEGPGFGLNASHCVDFDPGTGVDRTFGIEVSKGATLTLDLQWAEAWEGVATDLDAFLFAPDGELLALSADDNVFGPKPRQPFELIGWENDTGAPVEVQLVINRYSGESPRLKFALLQNGGGVTSTEYPESLEEDEVGPTIFGHNGAADAVSAGAIRYDAAESPEKFSSRGPVTHYFGPVNGLVPAAELSSPDLLEKPDIVATDGGANTFFGVCSLKAWRFFGTSAAAPHAAAVAALQREASPAATGSEVGEAQRESAIAVGAFPPEAVGGGMIDAVKAIEFMGVTPTFPGALPEAAPSPISCASSEPEPEPEPEEDPEPEESESDGEAPAAAAPVPPVVDAIAPNTFIQKRPRKVVLTPWRRGRAVFRFRSNEPGVFFFCQFDRKRLRRCGPRFVRWFRVGRHVLRVKARDAAGNFDPSPAVYRFRVRRVSKEQFARFNRASRRQARHERP